jgi:endonuclease/exonuclease/phosphatase family metal-dependent hydrolase
MFDGYSCEVSSRAGRSTSTEQVGLLYKDDLELVDFIDYNPDDEDRWERPPVEAVFNIDGYELKLFNIHIKPDSVNQELSDLEYLVSEEEGNVILLGDFNADCSYFDPENTDIFSDWEWVIPNGEDTTVAAGICAYDRIIANEDATKEVIDYGIDSEDIDTSASDHYIVWTTINTNDK